MHDHISRKKTYMSLWIILYTFLYNVLKGCFLKFAYNTLDSNGKMEVISYVKLTERRVSWPFCTQKQIGEFGDTQSMGQATHSEIRKENGHRASRLNMEIGGKKSSLESQCLSHSRINVLCNSKEKCCPEIMCLSHWHITKI